MQLFNYEKEILKCAGFTEADIENFEKVQFNEIIYRTLLEALIREKERYVMIETDISEEAKLFGIMKFVKEFFLDFNILYINLDRLVEYAIDVKITEKGIENEIEIAKLKEYVKEIAKEIKIKRKDLVIVDNFDLEYWNCFGERKCIEIIKIFDIFMKKLKERGIGYVFFKRKAKKPFLNIGRILKNWRGQTIEI